VLFIPMFIANTIAQGVVRAADSMRTARNAAGGRKTFAAVVERLDLITLPGMACSTISSFAQGAATAGKRSEPGCLQMLDMTPELCAALRETVNAPDEKRSTRSRARRIG